MNPLLSPDQLFSLQSRVILVTGASSGLGAVLAEGVAAARGQVVITGRSPEKLERVASRIAGCHAFPCDLTDPNQVGNLVDRVIETVGGADGLVNCAGDSGHGVPALRETESVVDQLIALHIKAPLLLAKLLVPSMQARGGGSIVNVTSISGLVGVGKIPQAAYVATKHALTGLTKELALQWGEYRIRVNAVAPGFFATDLTRPLRESKRLEDWFASNSVLPPFAQPEQLVGAVLLLLSEAGSYITGQTIAVDGGWTAR